MDENKGKKNKDNIKKTEKTIKEKINKKEMKEINKKEEEEKTGINIKKENTEKEMSGNKEEEEIEEDEVEKEEDEVEKEEEGEEEIEEKEENEKKVIIELNENLKNHIKNKIFILNDKLQFNFTFLYNKICRKSLFKKLDIFYYDTYAIIPYKNLNYIFFYNLISVEFKFIYQDISMNTTDKFLVCSSYELSEYCQKKDYKPYLIIDNEKYEFKYIFENFYPEKFLNSHKIILEQDNRKYTDYKKENTPSNFPSNNSLLDPKELSKFFDLFFKFENVPNFQYWESKKRNDFIYFILKYKSNEEIHCFKFCGPSGIGKSMTLFLISKYYSNFLYYNLKTIKILKKDGDNLNIQNILTESCKYLNLKTSKEKELSTLIKNNRFLTFFLCLKEIVKFLIKIKLSSVIILDQYKNDAIDKKVYNEILSLISKQDRKKVKLVICSSTNDKEIREECIKSWNSKIFFLTQHNKDNQNYYFYIGDLYKKDEKINDSYDTVLNEFNYIPKYKNQFKYLKEEGFNDDIQKKLNKDMKEIRNKIEKNLTDLYALINEKDKSEEIIKMKMIESLRYIFLNINKKLNYEKLDEFTSICSFKYYRFTFENDYFLINYNFPFMSEVINEIINTHIEEFYKYKRNGEHSGSASSDFFELFSGKSIKNGILKLPESENCVCIKVNEIVEMKEFSKSNLDDLIKSEIYSKIKQYTVKKKNFNIEDNDKELEERNILLSLNRYINYNDKNIEYYRLKYIKELNKEYIIWGNENLGDMSVFINQKNQRGRKLDLAYVYGKKENKTFIGFQMKAYDEESSHDIIFNINKENLKEALQPMIVNIKYLMNMDIKFWHYVVIILYDRKKEEGKQYFHKIVKLCINNGLEYIFYEPFENQFYNRNLEEITKFIPNQISNLDNNIEDILPINIMEDLSIDKYMKEFSEYMKEKKFNNVNYIKEGLITLINKKRKREKSNYKNKKQMKEDIQNVLNEIFSALRIRLFFKSVKFVGAYKFLNTINIPTPKNNYLFLIPSNKEEIYFIIFKNQNSDYEYYEYNMYKEINILDENISESIINVEPNIINANINKNEKFYVLKFSI